MRNKTQVLEIILLIVQGELTLCELRKTLRQYEGYPESIPEGAELVDKLREHIATFGSDVETFRRALECHLDEKEL